MPDDSKKNQDKKKYDPKEQRKPRNSRNQAGKQERKSEKTEESKSTPKVIPQKPPVYEDPGPEFYKNLKRETDEILKITEEESSKYKKKEIQSNWSKYEMPIESYEEIEEHDVGADYEKLIQAPLSVGGHFQFKHEKSWDVNTGPSLYDKYFNINMDSLSIAITSIPFHERNNIDLQMFSDTDMTNMKNRAAKYSEKYKNYMSNKPSSTDVSKMEIEEEFVEKESVKKDDVNLDFSNLKVEAPENSQELIKRIEPLRINEELLIDPVRDHTINDEDNSKLKLENLEPPKIIEKIEKKPEIKEENDKKVETRREVKLDTKASKVSDDPVVTNPVIESPEDLEKWLDDFLDG